MSSGSHGHGQQGRNFRSALDPLAESSYATTSSTTASVPGKLEILSKAMFAPFSHQKSDTTRILADLAPVIMTPRMINAASSSSQRKLNAPERVSHQLDFATLGRKPMRMTLGSRRVTSRDLQIVEATSELLQEDVPEPQGVASDVSLLRGFNATIPTANRGKMRRRQTRNVDVGPITLKMQDVNSGHVDDEAVAEEASEDDTVFVGKNKGKWKPKRRGRQSLGAGKSFGREELDRQADEILRDKENLHVRRALINSEISEITHKIATLDAIRDRLEQDLLKLQEDELELDDELQGIQERRMFEQGSNTPFAVKNVPPPSRRRRGPAFLPSEHHELPPGVAFMTLSSHSAPITALDFNEPYGFLVSASWDDTTRLWDLYSGEEVGRLRGHHGTVNCLQVEDQLCLTGGADTAVRIWDLRNPGDPGNLGSIPSNNINKEVEGAVTASDIPSESITCVRVLEGHSKPVTSLCFDGSVLVTGASDKTIRQWDMNTGQCVLTMDILWAIAHPGSTQSYYTPRGPVSASEIAPDLLKGAVAAVGTFSVPTPPYADGGWDMYDRFVGGLQIVYEGLISGSGDGVLRTWDMRTGSVSRNLMGHTGPITCVSCDIDTFQIVSGSLDKTIRIWDIRTGGFFETLKYDYGVTALQFDTRKIIASAGENGVKVYNRITMRHSTLTNNGHSSPTERLRYIDSFLASGGQDATVKIWAI